MGTVTRAWRKEAAPPPPDELWQAAARRPPDPGAFATAYATYCSQLRAEGYPPPTLMGWLDEETGEVS